MTTCVEQEVQLIRRGTYVKHDDGNLYHNPLTSWNFPRTALRDYLSGRRYGSMESWEMVTDPVEKMELSKFLGGALIPGQTCEVHTSDLDGGRDAATEEESGS